MMAFVSNCLVPLELTSSNSYPWGSTSPSISSLRTFVTIPSSLDSLTAFSGMFSSHMSMSSGVCSTGSPAKSLSMPMPSISCILRLKYQDRYAFLRMLLPSGLFFLDFVRKSSAFSMGIVYTAKPGGGICVIPSRLSSLSYSHW